MTTKQLIGRLPFMCQDRIVRYREDRAAAERQFQSCDSGETLRSKNLRDIYYRANDHLLGYLAALEDVGMIDTEMFIQLFNRDEMEQESCEGGRALFSYTETMEADSSPRSE